MSRPAAVVAPLVTALVVAVGVLSGSPRQRPAGDPGRAPRAVEVLRAWDVRRAEAWSRGDVAALRGLYVAGSRAGRRDARALAAYVDRGLTVRSMRMQLLSTQVLLDQPQLIRIRVTDRLAGATAAGGGAAVRLPAARASIRTMTLLLDSGVWRMEAVVYG